MVGSYFFNISLGYRVVQLSFRANGKCSKGMKELSKTSKLPAPGSLAVYHAWISAVVLIRSRILSTELWPEGHFSVSATAVVVMSPSQMPETRTKLCSQNQSDGRNGFSTFKLV